MLRLPRIAALVVVFAAIAGCGLRFVPAYDAAIEKDINDLHKKVIKFLIDMDKAGRSPSGRYGSPAVKSFYSEATAETSNLVLRVTLRETRPQGCAPANFERLPGPLAGLLDQVAPSSQPANAGPQQPGAPAAGPNCASVPLTNVQATLQTVERQHANRGFLVLANEYIAIFNTHFRSALAIEAALKAATP